MLTAASLERQKQPARIKSQKSSPIQLADVDYLTKSFPKRPFSSAKVNVLSCAAKREQGGKKPWR